MKVIIIIHNQVFSGVFYKAHEYCRCLIKQGVDAQIICTSNKNKFFSKLIKVEGISVYCSPDFLSGKLRQGIDIYNIIRRIIYLFSCKFDIIHAIDSRPVVIVPAILIKNIKKKPLVISWWDKFGRGGTAVERSGKIYNYTFGNIETFFEERFRKYADFSSVVTNYLKIQLINLGVTPNSIEINRVGGYFHYSENFDLLNIRKKLKLPLDKKILLYVGSIFNRDLNFLLDSLEILQKEYLHDPLIIMINSKKFDEKIGKRLNIIQLNKIEDTNTFYNYIKCSDFGLIPFNLSIANQARWPSKVSDYWSHSLPVISTKISDFELIFKKFSLGFLSEEDSPHSFAASMNEAILADQIKINKIKSDIRLFFIEELEWSSICNNLIKHYSELI